MCLFLLSNLLCSPGRQWRAAGYFEEWDLVADWGHELGLGLCQGTQTWSIRERDGIYRLDLPANEGNFLYSWAVHVLELKSWIWEDCTLAESRHFHDPRFSWILSPLCSRSFHPSVPYPYDFSIPLYAHSRPMVPVYLERGSVNLTGLPASADGRAGLIESPWPPILVQGQQSQAPTQPSPTHILG